LTKEEKEEDPDLKETDPPELTDPQENEEDPDLMEIDPQEEIDLPEATIPPIKKEDLKELSTENQENPEKEENTEDPRENSIENPEPEEERKLKRGSWKRRMGK